MCKRINMFMPLLFLFYISGSIAVGIVSRTLGITLPYWLQACISEGLIMAAGLAYVLVMKINIVKCIPYRKIKPLDALLSLLFGCALIPFMLFVSNLTMLFTTNYLSQSQAELTSYPFLVQIIIMAVLPPLAEEFVFRGLFYHSYRKNGILGAVVMSGLVFGCFHLNINQFCYAAVMGMAFALVVEATGSMWASMIAHFAVNSYSIVMIKLASLVASSTGQAVQQKTLADYPVSVIVMELIVLAVVAAAFLGIAYLLFMLLAKRNGRWEYIKENVKKGFKPQNNEHLLTMPAVGTLFITACMMIFWR